MLADDTRIADAAPDNWVDRHAPRPLRPWLKLMRADRPIGIWLLVLPCWWSVMLAWADAPTDWDRVLWFLLLFAIGAIVMRGAGCAYNDIVDRDIDARVARTARRPIPSGQVSVAGAAAFTVGLSLIGLLVLVQFNAFTVVLGVAALIPIALYPFMKRWTWWPQAFLGITFNWGALMGWAAMTGGLGIAPLLLYLGAVFWTLGYDTIYAHQDKEDDVLAGVRSSALKLGLQTKPWLAVFYSAALALWWLAGAAAGMAWIYFVLLVAMAAHLYRQIIIVDLDRFTSCLSVFKSNRDAGAILFVACALGALL
jgi:4-hydroxybenzoate polyprenyltransferase